MLFFNRLLDFSATGSIQKQRMNSKCATPVPFPKHRAPSLLPDRSGIPAPLVSIVRFVRPVSDSESSTHRLKSRFNAQNPALLLRNRVSVFSSYNPLMVGVNGLQEKLEGTLPPRQIFVKDSEG